jgi:hypothetical protein
MRIATAMIAVQMGVDDTRERLVTYNLLKKRICLFGVRPITGVDEYGLLVIDQQDVVG